MYSKVEDKERKVYSSLSTREFKTSRFPGRTSLTGLKICIIKCGDSGVKSRIQDSQTRKAELGGIQKGILSRKYIIRGNRAT